MLIIVFPDGRTFHEADGCYLARVPDDLQNRDVRELVENHEEHIVYTFTGDEAGSGEDELLSAREKDIVRLLALGYSNEEVARSLEISPATVATHRARIHKKLGIKDRQELVAYAFGHGLFYPFIGDASGCTAETGGTVAELPDHTTVTGHQQAVRITLGKAVIVAAECKIERSSDDETRQNGGSPHVVGSFDDHEATAYDKLSEREKDVLRLLAVGYTSDEIAKELRISTRTVESYRAGMKTKLKIKTRAEIVRYALQHGVIQP